MKQINSLLHKKKELCDQYLLILEKQDYILFTTGMFLCFVLWRERYIYYDIDR